MFSNCYHYYYRVLESSRRRKRRIRRRRRRLNIIPKVNEALTSSRAQQLLWKVKFDKIGQIFTAPSPHDNKATCTADWLAGVGCPGLCGARILNRKILYVYIGYCRWSCCSSPRHTTVKGDQRTNEQPAATLIPIFCFNFNRWPWPWNRIGRHINSLFNPPTNQSQSLAI